MCALLIKVNKSSENSTSKFAVLMPISGAPLLTGTIVFLVLGVSACLISASAAHLGKNKYHPYLIPPIQ